MREQPARMLASTMQTAPSCQFSPLTKKSSAQKNEPAHAKAAMCTFLRGERSTMAPTTGSRNALKIVAKLTRKNGSAPAATGMNPRRLTVLRQASSVRSSAGQPAALPATVIRYGLKSTVRTVV